MLTKAKPFLIGFLGACIGTILVLIVMHMYNDHVELHQMVAFINQQIQAAQKK